MEIHVIALLNTYPLAAKQNGYWKENGHSSDLLLIFLILLLVMVVMMMMMIGTDPFLNCTQF